MNKSAARCLFSVYFAVFFALLLFAQNERAQASTELARINDRVITLDEFDKQYKESVKFFQFHAPSKKTVLDELVRREIGIQEAKRLGVDKDPEVVSRINAVVLNALLEKKLTGEFEKIHISDDEAKSFYSKNPEVRTSQLFVALKPGASTKEEQEAMGRMKKMEEAIKEGKGFAEVAQQFSDGPTAQMGGDMDFQTRERLDPLYYETAVKLKAPGKMSGIVRSPFGYHIIKLTGVKTWEQADKAQVKRMVFDQRKVELFDKYMKELRQRAKVTLHEELLKD
jgi:peptidyl-prolyl cis-trans isomerase C/peptidyl-prolyl cis-trans isomerase D